jgi:predicted transposase YbfD/YdcC
MTNQGPGNTSETLFTQHFETLQDPRRTEKGNFKYPLQEILFLVISSIICGWNEWKDMVYFGKQNLEWLRRFYPYENGIPSHDTLEELFKFLDTKQFNQCFITWIGSISKASQGSVIALDGKTVRGAASMFSDSKLHIVSAFCSANKLCLGQVKVSDKSNEITAIPKLLDLICVKGFIITIDAMGCQKDIAHKIIEKGADYILMVKDNQPELKVQVEKIFSIQRAEKLFVKEEIDHGRIEKRTCEVIEMLDFLDEKEDWRKLHAVIRITSERTMKKTLKSSEETRYYISSLQDATAEKFSQSIREHWGIENELHWALDVVMKEDGQKNYAGNTAENLNIMRKIALGLLANEKTEAMSKNRKMKKALLEADYREKIMKC